MATGKIHYDIEAAVSGSSDVNELANQIDSLADTLEGGLKVQAQESAKALRELGAKQGAVENFARIKGEAGEAAARLREAQEAAQKLARELASSGAPTRAQAGQLEKLRDAVRTAKTEVQSKTAALDQSRAALNRYGVGTANLAQSERNLRAAIAGARAEVAQLTPAFTSAGKAVEVASSRTAGLSQQLNTLRNIAATALGGTLIGSLAKDLADVADGYDNLSARIKLATGEGQSFEAAMSEVQRVALDTNSNLDATGTLFARLAETGRSAGQGAQEAQADALGLTQTINEAIQVSGASSQAAQAAVTQLIQGLQSGVLRGEEFNSVVEQSPRLAKAMADGLGVTIGELRKMAQAGQLTATVVRDALRGQAQAVRAEFDQLPPTVGRAIENLNTAWTVYVGEVNKATGASKTAAQAIKALADNLELVVGLLIDLGQAAAAFAALRLAQQFLGIGAAATTSAAAIAANATALTTAGSAGTGAAAGAGRFAAALSSIKTFGLLAVLTNIEDIGVAIGEGVAKLQGYKDKTDELAQAERGRAKAAEEGRKIAAAQEAANKAARESQFELSKAASDTVSKFEELRSKGQSAAEAVATIGKDFDLASLPGIANAAGVLDKLAADGKLSADQVRQAWAEALKGEDLQAFEVKARAALSGTARESERLAQIMDASLREAIRRSGADFDVLAGGMSKATRSAINDTDTIIAGLGKLKEQGVDVGQALEASISKGIRTADSQAGVEALRTRIESLRKQLGEKVTDGLLLQLRNQAEQAGVALDKAAARTAQAFKNMGIATEADLKQAAANAAQDFELIKASGQATAEGLSQAWRRMAEASIAANGGVASETLRAGAAMQGLEISTDQTGRAIVKAMETGGRAVGGLTESINDASAAAAEYVSWADRMAQRNANVGKLPPAGRAARNGETLGEGVTEVGSGGQYRNRDGYASDAKGSTILAGGDLTTLTGIANFLKAAGLNDEQAKNLAREFSDGKGNIPYFSNAGQMKYGGEGSTMSQALLKAAERITFGGGNAGAVPIGRTVTVNLNVGGKSEAVPTTEEGAKALIRVLKDASLSAGR
ncbi:tape measure protein [Hydrogenophaga sp.]|uniref:tape measure protein n=1 Tax=Hydrogenophaga sp. TaxID=1904254 RepID=UPI003BB19EBF